MLEDKFAIESMVNCEPVRYKHTQQLTNNW